MSLTYLTDLHYVRCRCHRNEKVGQNKMWHSLWHKYKMLYFRIWHSETPLPENDTVQPADDKVLLTGPGSVVMGPSPPAIIRIVSRSDSDMGPSPPAIIRIVSRSDSDSAPATDTATSACDCVVYRHRQFVVAGAVTDVRVDGEQGESNACDPAYTTKCTELQCTGSTFDNRTL